MSAYRCESCLISWPHHPLKMGGQAVSFVTCPVCGTKTENWPYGKPIEVADARQILQDVLYERACERRDREREARGEPSPEEVGAQEARQLIELERAFAQGE